MTSPKRIEANRRNAAKSTGPRTPEGKSRARFNALKHGRAAKLPVLPGEDAEVYQGRIDTWTANLDPRDEVERTLVDQAARASWQLERAQLMQTAILTERIHDAAASNPEFGAEEAAALSFDDSDEGERMRQYQFSCNRAFLRALNALHKMRRSRRDEPSAEPLLTQPGPSPPFPQGLAPLDASAPMPADDGMDPPDLAEAVPAPVSQPTSDHDHQNSKNEAIAAAPKSARDHRDSQNEANPAAAESGGDHQIRRTKPTRPRRSYAGTIGIRRTKPTRLCGLGCSSRV